MTTTANRTPESGASCPMPTPRSFNLGQTNPRLALQWHPTKNGSLTPALIRNSTRLTVWWEAECGHEWQDMITDRVRGADCLTCEGRQRAALQKPNPGESLEDRRPDVAAEWHPIRNGDLTPLDVKGSTLKVWWLCPKGHEWKAKINSRTSRISGCPYCANRLIDLGLNDLASQRPSVAAEWHPTRNPGLSPTQFTVGSSEPIWWLCSTCGHEWKTIINVRANGHRCPGCQGSALIPGVNDLATKNPSVAVEWHPTRNDGRAPIDVHAGSDTKAWWRCAQGHEWEAQINSRSRGRGCAACTMAHTSKDEIRLAYELMTVVPILHDNVAIRGATKVHAVDALLVDAKIVIEYDGEYWHRDKRDLDAAKTVDLEAAGYTVIRVRESGLPRINANDVTGQSGETFTTSSAVLEALVAQGVIPMATAADYQAEGQCRATKAADEAIAARSDGAVALHRSLHANDRVIAAEWHPTKNGNLTPLDVTAGSSTRAWWLCSSCGHDWATRVGRRTGESGTGCPLCARRLLGPNQPKRGMSLGDLHPELTSEWHPTRNGHHLPSSINQSSNFKAWWRCVQGHEWASVVHNRTRGTGCPECFSQRPRRRTKPSPGGSLVNRLPSVDRFWSHEKNDGYVASDLSHSSHHVASLICPHCGYGWTSPVYTLSKRTDGLHCPECGLGSSQPA